MRDRELELAGVGLRDVGDELILHLCRWWSRSLITEPLHRSSKLFRQHGLGQVIKRAETDRLYGVVLVAGREDHLELPTLQRAQQVESRPAGHLHIQEHEFGPVYRKRNLCFADIRRFAHHVHIGVGFGQQRAEVAPCGIVIVHQQGADHARKFGNAIRSSIRSPLPFRMLHRVPRIGR